jgi:hypothetical protein
VTPFQSQLTTDDQDPVHHRCMQQPAKLCSLGVCQHKNLWEVMLLAYFFTLILSWQDMDQDTDSITNCRRFSYGIPVWQSFGSIRKQKIMLTCLQMRHNCLTYAVVARCSHTCFYTVWWAHNHFTHSEVMAIFWQKLVYGIRVAMSIVLMLCYSPLWVLLCTYCCFKDFTGPYAACLSIIF